MGWTAATGHIDVAGLAVFGVLFFWQIPHTHAIAIYRQREYDAAGMKTLPSARGAATARRSIKLYLLVQVAISFTPYLLGVAGLPYVIAASVLGAMVLVQGLRGDGGSKWAREVFLTSIIYMPILFAIMVVSGRAFS
jgi:protoheme IX farnesyltransferase